jgi:hypothetical protein
MESEIKNLNDAIIKLKMQAEEEIRERFFHIKKLTKKLN